MDRAVSFILVDKFWGRDLSLPALPSHSPDRMPPKSVVPGIGKRPVGRAAGKGSRKKAPLPFKFFLSINPMQLRGCMSNSLQSTKLGGWAIKATNIFIY